MEFVKYLKFTFSYDIFYSNRMLLPNLEDFTNKTLSSFGLLLRRVDLGLDLGEELLHFNSAGYHSCK